MPSGSASMNTNVEPEQSNPETWQGIREHQLGTVIPIPILIPTNVQAPPAPHPSSTTLERLPDEILVAIMKHLDHESLYRLSQTTGYFLRLSFDIVFESDPAWRAFRHAADAPGDTPRWRVLDWDPYRADTAGEAQESEPLSPTHVPSSVSGTGVRAGPGAVIETGTAALGTKRLDVGDPRGLRKGYSV